MDDKRRYGRFETQLKAQYISQDNKGEWEECTVISMSRKGICIKFHTRENINEGSPMQLKVFVPEKLKPTIVEGVLKWIGKKGNVLFGGIECNEILDEMKFSKFV